MINENFKEKDLPLKDMEALGLAKNGKLSIDRENLKALLSGNRTDLVRLNNLSSGGIAIDSLDAKLALRKDENGKVNLLLHPIYKNAQAPTFLSQDDIKDLKSGDAANIPAEIGTGKDKKTVFVEFDNETNEFITVDTAKVIAPEAVNDQPLNSYQKRRYSEGHEIELQDGTKLQATAKDKQGITSNRSLLVLSIIFDGGLTLLLVSAIKALAQRKEQKQYTQGYNDALNKVLQEQKQRNIPLSNLNNNLIVLKDFKEVLPKFATLDNDLTPVVKTDGTAVQMQPKHLEVLRGLKSFENLEGLTERVNPEENRKLAAELNQGKGEQVGNDPLKIENTKWKVQQLEHFATLAEVVAMIETKRDHVLDYIQDSGNGVNDQDYLKDVVTSISSSLSPEVKNVANQFVNQNQEVLDTNLEESEQQKAEIGINEGEEENVNRGIKR